jgi:TonB-dependent receptor
MANGRLGRQGWLARTGYLGGIRFEEVKTKSFGWVRARRADPLAAADPIGAATRDYANSDLTLYGGFRKKFPSIHAFHDITSNLKARVSYSTGYGRAPLGNLLPGVTVNSDNATSRMITVNNPSLKPQQAKNWDATLEYYFEPVGSLTFGWFHKDIRDFIVSNQEVRIIPGGPNNGYEGEYEGFIERTSLNSGSVIVQGWEFSYSQQFTFLPGLLKGLAASFNYSWTDQHGLRDGAIYLTRRDIAGFIPHAANASLSWRYRKVGVRALYNFTGENATSINLANPALSQFRYSMKTLNVGFTYQHRPNLGFTLDASNVLNEPQRWYNGYKDRMYRTTINFVTITIGVNGRF